ncbi:MAG TPA: hypothetical protein VMY77_14235 [Chitinophagaceae bacterium]|nr:hypothetical protein [Chitinophagaceae bacterium]
MRDDLHFDDYVKKQFSNYSPDVPPHIWQNIIAKRSLRPKGFWVSMLSGSNILILSIILLIGGGTSYFLLSPGNKNVSTKEIASEKNDVSKSENISAGENKTENNTATNDQSSEIKEQSQPVEENTIEGVSNESSANSANTSINKFSDPSQRSGLKTDVYKDKTDENNKEDLFVVQNNNEVTNTRSYSPFRFNNAREITGTKDIKSLTIKLPDCPTIEKNAAGNKKYWEVYAGPDYAFESYKSYGDTASANYLEKRKASTKFASAFSAGARYTKVFNNGTSVRAGVNFTQVNEKFLYFNPSEIKYVTVITTRVVIRAPGDTIYINDTLQYQQTGKRTKITYNRYRNIDIPVVFGYELGNGKIHANINAGVIINVYSWYKGDVLDSLYQPVTITTGKSNSIYQFKNNVGVGFLGSISVYYKMTDNLHLVLEPYFRYNLSPMSKQNLNLQQKYNIAGLRAGVRFDLK